MAFLSARASTLTFDGVLADVESVRRRLGEGSSGDEGEAAEGEECAARCMNFMVKSLEDIALGALPGVLAADILKVKGGSWEKKCCIANKMTGSLCSSC